MAPSCFARQVPDVKGLQDPGPPFRFLLFKKIYNFFLLQKRGDAQKG